MHREETWFAWFLFVIADGFDPSLAGRGFLHSAEFGYLGSGHSVGCEQSGESRFLK